MNLPLISTIIPTLNAAKTIGACLDSLFSQDFPREKMEVIVVDNNSTDNTKSIARRYTDKVFDINDHFTPPLKVRGGAGGVMKPERSAQVNFGVTHAQGEYLYKIDADFGRSIA